MSKPLSMDLRSRALGAVDEGMSCRAAERRFGVARRYSDTLAWLAPEHGQLRRQAAGRRHTIGADAKTILALQGDRQDITLDEPQQELRQAGVSVAILTLSRFFTGAGSRAKRLPTRISSTVPTS